MTNNAIPASGFHPKGVGSGGGQGSVRDSQVLPKQTEENISLWRCFQLLANFDECESIRQFYIPAHMT